MMLRWLWLSGLVIFLDQLSKILASNMLELGKSLELFPMFNFTLLHNEGAAFSFLSTAGGWQRWFFSMLAIVVSVVIVRWIRKLSADEQWQAAGLALVLGGALGNVIDRLVHGYVVDFIDFYYSAAECLPLFYSTMTNSGAQCHWPAFNIADSAISVGVVMLIWDSIREHRQHRKQQVEQQHG